MSAEFVSSVELPILNGVGTVGYTVFDGEGTELSARTADGVSILASGADYSIYTALVVVDDGVTAGTVVWDDGDGNLQYKQFFIGSDNSGAVSVGEYTSELDATWGGTAADSYLTLVEAEDLIQKYVWETTVWYACTGQKKDQALRMATRRLDMHNYIGRKQTLVQALQFPRFVDYIIEVTRDQIITDVKLATVIEALDLVGQRGISRHRQNQAAGLKQISESVGPIRDQYTYNSAGPATLLCFEASRIMARYIRSKQSLRA